MSAGMKASTIRITIQMKPTHLDRLNPMRALGKTANDPDDPDEKVKTLAETGKRAPSQVLATFLRDRLDRLDRHLVFGVIPHCFRTVGDDPDVSTRSGSSSGSSRGEGRGEA